MINGILKLSKNRIGENIEDFDEDNESEIIVENDPNNSLKFIEIDGKLYRLDFRTLINKPSPVDFVIGDTGTEDDGILYVDGISNNKPNGIGYLDIVKEYTKNIEDQMKNMYYYSDPYILNNNNVSSALFTTAIIAPDINGNGLSPLIDITDRDESKYILVIPYDLYDNIWVNYDGSNDTIISGTLNVSNGEYIREIIIPRGLIFHKCDNVQISFNELTQYFPNLETVISINRHGIVSSYNIRTQTLN